MRCRATVLKTEGNIAEIEVRRATMCEGCEKSGGCGGHCDITGIVASGGKMTAKAYNKIGAAAGDTVEVETESSRVLAYAALVFLLPLVIGGIFFAAASALVVIMVPSALMEALSISWGSLPLSMMFRVVM